MIDPVTFWAEESERSEACASGRSNVMRARRKLSAGLDGSTPSATSDQHLLLLSSSLPLSLNMADMDNDSINTLEVGVIGGGSMGGVRQDALLGAALRCTAG